MPRDGAATKRHIIDTAYAMFYRQGYARAGVERIAQAAGITKRTLHYHFESKDTLIAAALLAQNELMLAHIAAWLDRARGDPCSMIEIVFNEFVAWALCTAPA